METDCILLTPWICLFLSHFFLGWGVFTRQLNASSDAAHPVTSGYTKYIPLSPSSQTDESSAGMARHCTRCDGNDSVCVFYSHRLLDFSNSVCKVFRQLGTGYFRFFIEMVENWHLTVCICHFYVTPFTQLFSKLFKNLDIAWKCVKIEKRLCSPVYSPALSITAAPFWLCLLGCNDGLS